MVTETDRNKARSAVVSVYNALDCVGMPVSFLHAFADAAVDAVSTGAEPVKTAPAVAVKATPEALEQFTAYFVKNYPGPDTIIFDPKWHAPKIFRAAISALSAQVQDVEETLETYYQRQIEWSRETFGPALRTKGIIDHITKELREIEADPHDLSEWVDVVILAMDGFWRHGGNAEDLFRALIAKQKKNMARSWPDWRTMSEDSAIEHDRSKDVASPASKHGDAE